MGLSTYKLLHLIGLGLIAYAFGGLEQRPEDGQRKRLTMVHGIALLLTLLGGFGMAAKNPTIGHTDWWILVKLGIWLVLGGALVIYKRKPELIGTFKFVILALMIVAAYLGLFHHSIGS